MFKEGDLVKLKPGAVIETSGYDDSKRVSKFLSDNEIFKVSSILKREGKETLIGLHAQSIFSSGFSISPTYFLPDHFELYKSKERINEERNYKELTKLEYAAIMVASNSNVTSHHQDDVNWVITMSKKILEACNE